MNWNECIICQEKIEEELRFPKNRKNFDALPVYTEFLENVLEFRKLDEMPVILPFDAVLSQVLFDNNAVWHHSCHQKFTKSRLERARKKRKKCTLNDENVRRSKRHRLSV